MTHDAAPANFRAAAEALAVAWKHRTPTLPDDARAAAPYIRDGDPQGLYAFCLPRQYSDLNLLPDVREQALQLFRDETIRWHADVDGHPSNHLLDSQVQCVNALVRGVHDASHVRAAFGDVLPIAEVMEIEPGRTLTFEYIGASDHLTEASGPRTRGALATSADAAIRYRTPLGAIEMALIEWKFTEDYRGKELRREKRKPRPEKYRWLWEASDCPLRRDGIPYLDLFVEPFYQLMRQQLLASRMEQARELGAERVVVVHVCPGANDGVRAALNRPSHREFGSDALEIWSAMCVQPDRFVSIDSRPFATSALGSTEYVDRYRI